jgi:aminopeptidase N
LKNALHIYFTKYSWKNTEFADFISSLQEAYDKQHDSSKVMGKNFDIMEWSNTWLKTSGVNLLEGNAQYGKNDTLEKFSIR